jgi:hypothetical protein
MVPGVALSPEKATAHFGWLGMFAGLDLPASSAQTRERLGWHPTGSALIADLDKCATSALEEANGATNARWKRTPRQSVSTLLISPADQLS